MKTLFITLPSMLLTSVTLASTPTAEIIVKGIVSVPSCTVAAEDGQRFDLGQISLSTLQADVVTKALTINCSAETYMLFSAVDNRAGTATASSNTSFGFGTHNGEKIGTYQVKIDNAMVDGVDKKLAFDTDSFGLFTPSQEQWLDTRPNAFIGWSDTSHTLSVGKTFTADLSVHPSFARLEAAAENIDLDGSFTMNFRFGI